MKTEISSVTAYGVNTPTQGFTAQVTIHGKGLEGGVKNLESLIAAAPELLDASRRLMQTLAATQASGVNWLAKMATAKQDLIAAIAKAEGR